MSARLVSLLPPRFQLLFGQISKFGIAGIGATIIHFVVLALLVEFFSIEPQLANFGGYLIAFLFSFFMNYYWTFSMASTREGRLAVAKRCVLFFFVALIGYFLNAFWVYVATDLLVKPYYYSYPLMIMFTPPVTFLFNKLLVFRTA